MLRPVLPAVRPFRCGAICLFLAVTLGLSAGTIGVGPGGVAAGLVGRGVGQDARRDGGGDARLGRRDARRHRRRAHPRRLPVHRGRAAADRRVGRGRDQVHVGLGVLRPRASCAARSPPSGRGRPDDLATLERSTRVRVERPAIVGETPEFEPKPKRAREKKAAERRELLVGRGALPGPLRRRRTAAASPSRT